MEEIEIILSAISRGIDNIQLDMDENNRDYDDLENAVSGSGIDRKIMELERLENEYDELKFDMKCLMDDQRDLEEEWDDLEGKQVWTE